MTDIIKKTIFLALIVVAVLFAVICRSGAASVTGANQPEPDAGDAHERTVPNTKLEKRIEAIRAKIRRIESKWAQVEPLDRLTATLAVHTVRPVGEPKVIELNAARGAIKGEVLVIKLEGSPGQIADFAESLETTDLPMIVENLEVRYMATAQTGDCMVGGATASFRIFAPTRIPFEPLPESATDDRKEILIGDTERTLEKVKKLYSDPGRSFKFLTDVVRRWPLGFPPVERLRFVGDTFTVYPSYPPKKFDPFIAELARELNRVAAPLKVNLAPLLALLVDGREVKCRMEEDRFIVSWRGIEILSAEAQSVISHLPDIKNIYVVMEVPPSEDIVPLPLSGCGPKYTWFVVRSYDLRDGSIIWEDAFCDSFHFTNLVMDAERRIVYGRGYLLTMRDSTDGRIIKRWPLSLVADELAMGKDGNIIVCAGLLNETHHIKVDEAGAPLFLRAGTRSADQLYHETVNNLIPPGEHENYHEKNPENTVIDIIGTKKGEVSDRARRLAPMDPTNPWYLFFEGVADYLSESGKAAEKLKKAVLMSMENPYHYLQMGNVLEKMELYGPADMAYGEAYRRFIAWYRPNEIYSRFTGHIFFLSPATDALTAGKEERALKLLEWLRKFQPLGEKMDIVELETAAWWHKKEDKRRETEAMTRYRHAAGEAYGLTLRRYFKSDQMLIITCVLLTVFVFFLLIMTLKYGKSRRATFASLGHKNLRSRMIAAAEKPALWFKFNTISFMSGAERRVLLLLWVISFVFASSLLITYHLSQIQDHRFFIYDYVSTRFEKSLTSRLGVERKCETYFILGLAHQQRGDPGKASNYYSNRVFDYDSCDAAASALNNRGVIEFENGNMQKAEKLFNEAIRKDPWLPEPLFNRGIIENKDSLKQRAIALGLEQEYLDYYPDRPVRCGFNADIFAAAFTGFGFDIVGELADRWAEALTGNLAWKYANRHLVSLYYIYLIIGLVALIYQFTSRHELQIEPYDKVGRWGHFIPGAGWMLREKPLLGSLIAALFLYSLFSICIYLRFGVPGIFTAMAKPSPLVFPDLSTADLFRQEPLIRGFTIFTFVALPASILINSIGLLKVKMKGNSLETS